VRIRLVIPAALASAALVLIPALPAAAATTTWTSPTDSWWSAASWTTSVPTAGDDIVFAGGVRSTYELGSETFSSLRFTNEHLIANGGGAITLTHGLIVEAGAFATIEPALATSGSQTFDVAAGGSLTLPSIVTVDPASSLTLDVDGSLSVTTGRLDGGAAACIRSIGSGVVAFSSGGGVGTCPGYPLGLVVTAGETTFTPGAFLGGTDIVAAGGLVTGGSDTSPATVRQLSLIAGGTVSPGGSAGSGIGHLALWGTTAWTGGTYVVDVTGGGGPSDRVAGQGRPISVAGTVLSPRLIDLAVAGESWSVLESDVAVNGQFVSPDGATLASGDEFEANGQIFSVAYLPTSVEVTWERAAPVVLPPVIPAAPSLPETGAAAISLSTVLLALGSLLAGVVLVLVSRRLVAAR